MELIVKFKLKDIQNLTSFIHLIKLKGNFKVMEVFSLDWINHLKNTHPLLCNISKLPKLVLLYLSMKKKKI